MGFSIVGFEPEGLLIAGHRLVELVLLLQDVPQVVVGIGVGGLEVDGLSKPGRRLLEPALLRQHDAQVVLGLGVVGLEPESLLSARERIGRVRIGSKTLAVDRLPLVSVTGLMILPADRPRYAKLRHGPLRSLHLE
jgi:hypothetical protein